MENKQDLLIKSFVEIVKSNNLQNKEAFEIAKMRTQINDIEYSSIFDTLASLAKETKHKAPKLILNRRNQNQGNPFHKKPITFDQKLNIQKQKNEHLKSLGKNNSYYDILISKMEELHKEFPEKSYDEVKKIAKKNIPKIKNPEIMKIFLELKEINKDYDEKYLMFIAKNQYFNNKNKPNKYFDFLLEKINEKMFSEHPLSYYEAKNYAKEQWILETQNS